MFGPRKAVATYNAVDLETRVSAASQHELIQMLYDGAILALNRAVAAIDARDINAKGTATTRAISIIEEGLRASLDRNVGGALAESLDGLYEYMSQRLLLASMRNDANGFVEVRKLLLELRDAWGSIGKDAAAPVVRQPALHPVDVVKSL